MRKSTWMSVFRAMLFGVLAFAMLALMHIRINSSLDVAGFVLGAAVIWYLIELVVFRAKSKPTRKGPY